MTHQQVSQCLIFLHIPKAAGSTLNQIIEHQYQSKVIFTVDPSDALESKAKLTQLNEAQKSEIQVLKGHMAFGWHKLLPQNSTYITMLRDPIERVISFYYYILSRPMHYLYEIVTQQNITLDEFINSGMSAEIENCQTRLLSGKEELIQKPFAVSGKCPNEWLESAKENLNKHFIAFGITEKFDESLILFKQKLKWNTPFYVKKNVNQNRLIKNDISEKTLQLIEESNQLDIELYKYANRLFEEQIDRHRSAIEADLRRFRQFNQAYKVYADFINYSQLAKNKVKSVIKGCA